MQGLAVGSDARLAVQLQQLSARVLHTLKTLIELLALLNHISCFLQIELCPFASIR